MPQAIGLLAGLGSFTGTFTSFIGLTTAAGGLTLAGSLLNIAGSFLLSTAANALLAPGTPTPDNIQVNSKASAAVRNCHYGVVKSGGNVAFHRAAEGVSYRLIVHGHGEISNILQMYLNNVAVDLDGAGYVTDDQYQYKTSRVQILGRKGIIPEAHYGEITDTWPAWTPYHRLDGQWTSLIKCAEVPASKFRAMYPNGEPNISALAETTKCFDPRTGETVFTENAALIIADYVASKDGFNRPDALDAANIAEQADICDRDVALAVGGTEKKYRLSGSYTLAETPQTVLKRMLIACGGRVRLMPSGKPGLTVGAWQDPEFTITKDMILEVQDVNPGPDLLDRYNELPARFNSHGLGHVEVDAESWIDAQRVVEDGEQLVGESKSILMSPSHRQTRQVMEILMERDNSRLELTLLCKPMAMPAIYEQSVVLDMAEFGLAGIFEVDQHSAVFDGGSLKAVSLSLRRFDPKSMTQSLDDQGAVQVMPEPDTPSGVPVPQNVVAAPAGTQAAGDTFVAGVAIAWQKPPSDSLDPVLKISKTGVDEWQDVAVGNGVINVNVSGLIEGQGYDLSLAFMTPGGVVGEVAIKTDIIATAVASAPAAPSGLIVSDLTDSTALVEVTASVSPGLWKTEIYRDAVLVGVIYAAPGSAISFIDNCGPGSFSWAARSVNVSSISSTSDAGPIAATIA